MDSDIRTNEYGTKYYFEKGTEILHREDGPAIEYKCGDRSWYINGKRHNENGPAVYWWDRIEWWINGNQLSPEKEEILNKWWKNKNEQSSKTA